MKQIERRVRTLEEKQGSHERQRYPIIRKILMPGESLTEEEKSLLEERKIKGSGIVMIIRQIVSPDDLG